VSSSRLRLRSSNDRTDEKTERGLLLKRDWTMPTKGKVSRQPSPYASPLLFHTLRAAQVLSSVVVTIFLGFFIGHLERENYYVPWTFILVCLCLHSSPLSSWPIQNPSRQSRFQFRKIDSTALISCPFTFLLLGEIY
jgi:hypothetical protein